MSAITWIVLITELILVIVFVVPKIIGYKPYVVTSGSMKPKYDIGSLIYVKKVSYQDVKIGDAITFYMGNTKVAATHEVYKIDMANRNFYTQGINNLDDEGNIIHDALPVSFDKFIGKPVICIPKLGIVDQAITSRVGISIIAILTAGILIPSFLIERKEKNEK